MRLRRRDDLFRNRNKFASFAYKWALRLSYPIRRPLVFFPVLLLLFLAPTFAGVKPAEVHLWYWNKAKSGVMFVVDGLKGLWGKTEIDMSFIKSPFETRGLNRLAESSDNRPRSSKRQAFGQAAGVPQGVDVMKQAESGDIVVPVFHEKGDEITTSATVSVVQGQKAGAALSVAGSEHELENRPDGAYRKDVEGLVYLDHPQNVCGEITVYDANTIDVNGTYMILFGIYVSPRTDTGAEGKAYLRRVTSGKTADCHIVAYTLDKVATAICYLDGVNLNKQMVVKGYSANVAL